MNFYVFFVLFVPVQNSALLAHLGVDFWGVSFFDAGGLGARSLTSNIFHNKLKMSSLHCQCTEHMLASCDTPDSDWATLLVCVGVIFLILRHLRDEEDVSESPPTI